MAEQLTVYTPNDRFATMAKNGEARIWQIDQDGIPELMVGRPAPQPVEWRAPESTIFGKPISKITHEEAREWLPRFEGHDEDPEMAYCAAVLKYIASKPELPRAPADLDSLMDARAQQARGYHQQATDSTSDAALYRQQRDQLVRALRAEDPTLWSYRELAAAVGCSKSLIRQILDEG